MSDVMVFKIENLDRGFVARGPDNNEFCETLDLAMKKVSIYVETAVKALQKELNPLKAV